MPLKCTLNGVDKAPPDPAAWGGGGSRTSLLTKFFVAAVRVDFVILTEGRILDPSCVTRY